MSFLSKYELLQRVTKGPVETFVGRDIASGERILVHVLAGVGALANEAPADWALRSFCNIAPPLPGELIEGGRYHETQKAYLITKLPADSDVLENWVHLYKLQSMQTQELPFPSDGSPDSIHSDLIVRNAPKTAQQPHQTPAGVFGKEPASGSERRNEKISPPPNSLFTANAAVSEFGTPSPVTELTPISDEQSLDTAARLGKPDTGEFTKFFRGPFDVAQSSSASESTPETFDHISKPHETGEFTKVFGGRGAAAPPNEDISALVESPGQREAGTMTELFALDAPEKEKSGIEPARSIPTTAAEDREVGTHIGDFSRDAAVPLQEPLSAYVSAARLPTPTPLTSVDMTLPGPGGKSEGATNVFRPTGSGSAPNPEPLVAGPSDYTIVVSGGALAPDFPGPNPVPAAPASPVLKQAVPVQIPQVPAAPRPPMPVIPSVTPGQFPQAGQYPPAPAMPQPPVSWPPNVAMPPQLPPTPQPQPPSPPPRVSYLPLIIAMNVLFIAAVALVVYFALKH